VPGALDDGDVLIEPYELDHRTTILVFTARERLERAQRSHAGAIELPGRALLASLPPFDALVIDYATRLQKEMTPSEVAALLDGSLFALLRDDARVDRIMLGRPKYYPMAMLDALRPVLAATAGIRGAYLCQAQSEQSGAPFVIIGIDCDAGVDLAELDAIVRRHDPHARLQALADDPASEYMRRETSPWTGDSRDAAARE
jgi:hypothetical protein